MTLYRFVDNIHNFAELGAAHQVLIQHTHAPSYL